MFPLVKSVTIHAMDERFEFEDDEILARFMAEMERPRPFSTARMILAGGAVKWFLNLVAGVPAVGLLVLAAVSVGGSSTGGTAIITGIVVLGSLGYVAYRIYRRIREPFLRARLLRMGEVRVLPVVKRRGTAGVFSKFGVKSRSSYTLRYGEGPDDPVLETSFDGSYWYGGGSCVVLYEPAAGGNVNGSRGIGKNYGPDSEKGSGPAPPKRFFALDCFLFHRFLTFPDLLEGEEQERAREALGYDENWRSNLGRTGTQLFTRFVIALTVGAGIAGLLCVILRAGD